MIEAISMYFMHFLVFLVRNVINQYKKNIYICIYMQILFYDNVNSCKRGMRDMEDDIYKRVDKLKFHTQKVLKLVYKIKIRNIPYKIAHTLPDCVL